MPCPDPTHHSTHHIELDCTGFGRTEQDSKLLNVRFLAGGLDRAEWNRTLLIRTPGPPSISVNLLINNNIFWCDSLWPQCGPQRRRWIGVEEYGGWQTATESSGPLELHLSNSVYTNLRRQAPSHNWSSSSAGSCFNKRLLNASRSSGESCRVSMTMPCSIGTGRLLGLIKHLPAYRIGRKSEGID